MMKMAMMKIPMENVWFVIFEFCKKMSLKKKEEELLFGLYAWLTD